MSQIALNQAEDAPVRAVALPELFMLSAVFGIVPGQPVSLGLIQFIDHHVLDPCGCFRFSAH